MGQNTEPVPEPKHPVVDMEPFLKAVNETAGRSRGLWLGFIALLAYLFITVGAVSHRDLLLQSPVRLPILNVELPLVGFFVVAPIFFLINHFYLLLQLKGLSSRIQECNKALKGSDLPPEIRYRKRRNLDSFVIVQMLGGTEEERSGLTGWFLKSIALITLVFAPVILLLMIQLQFLPYQSEAVTWWHRIAVLVDLTLIWIFWFAIRKGDWDRDNRSFWARLSVLCLGLFSCFLASFPGEIADGGLNARTWKTHRDSNFWWLKGPLFGTIAPGENQAGDRERNWSGLPFLFRALELADNQALIDHDTFDKIRKRFRGDDAALDPWGEYQKPWQSQRTRSFRDRNLRGAVLDRSDLRNVDFEEARLQGASLVNASLQGASLDFAGLQGASLSLARLQGASLENAGLQGAELFGARLQGASLENAGLQGASLAYAGLQGASLFGASLQGASLFGASLQGASLAYARLQGASLSNTRLQGASLRLASLQGASLFGASLQGASLAYARLQGASLDRASLEGASLKGASLQGTSLDEARLQGASLQNVFLWRAYGQPTIGGPRRFRVSNPRVTAMTAKELDQLEQDALDGVENTAVREKILERLARLWDSEENITDSLPESFWADLELKGDTIVYQTTLAEVLKQTACRDEEGENAPLVVKGLLRKTERFRSSTSGLEALWPLHRRPLARHLLDAAEGRRDDCPGVKGLDHASISILRDWAAPAEEMPAQDNTARPSKTSGDPD